MNACRHLILLFVVAVATAASLSSPVEACAPAPPEGFEVDIVAEDAVIVWNAEAKTQHFIRRADFRSEAPGFGFLVPTPSKPELAEADDAVFDRLAQVIRPEIVWSTDWDVSLSLCLAWTMLSASSDAEPSAVASAPAVRVLAETRVAGYDAAVLAADDAGALERWLSERGYDFRPGLRDWLKWYVEKRWIITAFKIAKSEGHQKTRDVGSSAVRMSFSTEQPFFPYREPTDQRRAGGPARSLRLFVIGTERMQGRVGASGAWPGELKYADQLGDAQKLLADALPTDALPSKPWLSAFLDKSSPRPGSDELFFETSGTEVHHPPPITRIRRRALMLPVDLVVFLLLVGGGLVGWRRRQRATAGGPTSTKSAG